MQRSNTYVIIFSLVLSIILGGLLSLASVGLKPAQMKAEEFAHKRQILRAVLDTDMLDDIVSVYDNQISSFVVDAQGQIVETDEKGNKIIAEDIDIGKEFKKDPSERVYPIYTYRTQENPDDIEAYIFAAYGNGLWNNIWGFIALETDMNTISGVVFDHVGETAGLGARITEKEIQARYKGKKMFDDNGNLESVSMLKRENNPPESLDEHHINGISGATLTANGINRMIIEYINYYQPFIDKYKKENAGVASL